MDKLSSLTLRETYKQAKGQATLSRLLNSSWFGDAFAQDVRWHIWHDGKSIRSWVCGKSKKTGKTLWFAGPAISFGDLNNPTNLSESCRAIIAGGFPGLGKATGLGVIIHIGESFTTAIVRDEFKGPDSFNYTISNIRDTPQEIMSEDISRTVETAQWRFTPFSQKDSGVAVELSLSKLEAWKTVIKNDPRIKVTVLSAPLLMAATALRLITPQEEYVGRAKLYVLYYDRFTILMPVSQSGGVLDMRAIQHNQKDTPPGFASEVTGVIQKESLDQPVLVFVKCGDRSVRALVSDMEAYHAKGGNREEYEILGIEDETMEALLGESGLVIDRHTDDMAVAPEMLVEYPEFLAGQPGKIPANALEQTELQRISTAARDTFWYDDSETRESRLSRGATGALLLLKYGFRLGVLLLLAGFAYVAVTGWTAYRSEEWNQDPSVYAESQSKLSALQEKKRYLDHWTSRMEPRSQMWSSMEVVLGMFPESKDLLIREIRYSATPSKTSKGSTVGWERKWLVEGHAGDESVTRLTALQQTSEITRIFNETAARLKEPVYQITGSRTVSSNIRQEQNTEYNPSMAASAGSTRTAGYKYKFKAEIIQVIPEADALAIEKKLKAETATTGRTRSTKRARTTKNSTSNE